MVTLQYDRGRFAATGADRQERSALETFGASYSASRGGYLMPSHFAWPQAERLAEDLTLKVSPGAVAALDEEKALRETAAPFHLGEAIDDESLPRWLFPHQRAGVVYLRRFHRVILADEVGLGKTNQAILAVTKAPTLVIAPASLLLQWKLSIQEAIGTEAVIVGTKTPLTHDAAWHVTNYDVLQRRSVDFCAFGYGSVIADEAVRLKNPKAKRTAAFKRLVKRPEVEVYCLTATPIRNRPRELWTLLSMLWPKRYTSLWQFAGDLFETHDNGFGMELGGVRQDRMEEWRSELLPRVLRRERDLLDLPTLTQETVHLALDPKADKAYRQLKDNFAALRDNGMVLLAPNTLAQMIRLRQLTSDPALTGLPGASVKTAWLLDWLEDNATDRKAVVFSPFAEYVKLLGHATQAYHPAVFTGADTLLRRQEACRRLNEDDDCRLLISTDAAASEGLNLQKAASVVIFTGLPWTPDIVTQAIGRVYRQGQTQPVHVYTLVCSGTIDADIEEVLADKQNMATEALAMRAVAERLWGRVGEAQA